MPVTSSESMPAFWQRPHHRSHANDFANAVEARNSTTRPVSPAPSFGIAFEAGECRAPPVHDCVLIHSHSVMVRIHARQSIYYQSITTIAAKAGKSCLSL